MLDSSQLLLLVYGFWIVPLLTAVALVVFPWDHWNAMIEGEDESRR